jgi:predicted MPP superfamily phosphohydrolase
MDFLRRCGFIVLDNRMVVLADGIELAGVDDPAMGSETADVAVLSAAEPGSFTILLKHRPYINHQATPRFDLQLSGHTHNGQIFPFNFITDAVHPHPIGRQQIDDRTVLYTSRGTGTWGPPIRVLAPPELTLIEIKGKTG